MPSYTLYGDPADAWVYGNNVTYLTARSTAVVATDASEAAYLGQEPGYYCHELLLGFDTSVVAGAILSAVLSLYVFDDSSVTDFLMEARIHDWGPTATIADFVAGADLGSKTLVASRSTAGITVGAQNDLTSDAAFLTNINQAGFTRLVVNSSRHRNGDVPGGNEYLGIRQGDATTAQRPKLTIVTADNNHQLVTAA